MPLKYQQYTGTAGISDPDNLGGLQSGLNLLPLF